jgi:heme/copper-type cytochrome/quinol oxidase subunit 2
LIIIAENDIILTAIIYFYLQKTMKKKNLIFAIIGIVIVLILVILIVLNTKTTGNSNQGDQPKSSLTANETENNQENAPQSFGPASIPAELGVLPGSSGAPEQEVVTAAEIPATAIKLEVSDQGFKPNEFTVQAGEPVSLALTASGDNAHVFLFPIAAMMGLTTMVAGGETKMISFTAPAAGTYSFRDDIPKFNKNTGTMIVR